MKIEVRCENEVLFNGDADEFLEINEYDEDLEYILNRLDNSPIGIVDSFFENQCTQYEIEKLEYDLYED